MKQTKKLIKKEVKKVTEVTISEKELFDAISEAGAKVSFDLMISGCDIEFILHTVALTAAIGSFVSNKLFSDNEENEEEDE